LRKKETKGIFSCKRRGQKNGQKASNAAVEKTKKKKKKRNGSSSGTNAFSYIGGKNATKVTVHGKEEASDHITLRTTTRASTVRLFDGGQRARKKSFRQWRVEKKEGTWKARTRWKTPH